MYTLTLTHGERRAIDWIGNRYWNGNDLFGFLWCGCSQIEEHAWSDICDITFKVPEHIAWWIMENATNEGFPCFSYELERKFWEFIDKIV